MSINDMPAQPVRFVSVQSGPIAAEELINSGGERERERGGDPAGGERDACMHERWEE